jgi:hypothetical protein
MPRTVPTTTSWTVWSTSLSVIEESTSRQWKASYGSNTCKTLKEKCYELTRTKALRESEYEETGKNCLKRKEGGKAIENNEP